MFYSENNNWFTSSGLFLRKYNKIRFHFKNKVFSLDSIIIYIEFKLFDRPLHFILIDL